MNSGAWYIEEHAAAIQRARDYTARKYGQSPRYGVGWSRSLSVQALNNAAQWRRALANLRAPQLMLVVGEVPFAEKMP